MQPSASSRKFEQATEECCSSPYFRLTNLDFSPFPRRNGRITVATDDNADSLHQLTFRKEIIPVEEVAIPPENPSDFIRHSPVKLASLISESNRNF